MRRIMPGVLLLSAATLVFEITLSRVFAVAQWYHFAFMAVSVALLGFGASGTFLSLWPAPARQPGRWLEPISLAFGLSVLGGYLTVNYVPFDSYRIAWERIQLLYLAIYYLSLTIPFFFSGLAVGALLAAETAQVNRIYAATLAGSGLGSLGALAGLTWLSAPGVILVAAATGLLAAVVFGFSRDAQPQPVREPQRLFPVTHRASRITHHASRTVVLALMVALALLATNPPRIFDIRMSPYKTLSTVLRYPDTRVTFTGWNAFSRVDAIESSTIRSYPGLSFGYAGDTPAQAGFTVDGDNLSPITTTQDEAALAFLDALPTALPYRLIERPHALVIEPGGGLDVLQALHQGAVHVTAVEDNPLLIDVVRKRYDEFSGRLYNDPRVTIVMESGRGFVRRGAAAGQTYDLIDVALADTFKVVNFGAYSLTESPLYTVDGFQDLYRLLSDEGILVVTRWLQLPPSESLRAGALIIAALDGMGIEDPAVRLVAYRTFNTMTLLIRHRPFTDGQLTTIRRFLADNGFDLVAAPDISPAEVNQYNQLEEPVYYQAFQRLLSPSRARFIADYNYDISPPTDDRPFFFHYFRWSQVDEILATFGKTWQPFGGGGYLVLVLLLGLATMASLTLIVLPLAVERLTRRVGAPDHAQARPRYASLITLIVFFALGIGYLFIEIPLIQRFVVYLGHPTLAFAGVLVALLVFSGLGSLAAPRVPLIPALTVLMLGSVFYPALLRPILAATLGVSLPIRLVITISCLAPLGFFMGVPFPRSLALIEAADRRLVPWAWAINGCASVLSSILAAMLAVTAGLSVVLAVAGGAYVVALLAIAPLATGRLKGMALQTAIELSTGTYNTS